MYSAYNKTDPIIEICNGLTKFYKINESLSDSSSSKPSTSPISSSTTPEKPPGLYPLCPFPEFHPLDGSSGTEVSGFLV